MSRKTAGILCMILGALLILAAMLLVLYNRMEDDRAGQAAMDVMPQLVAIIEETPVVTEAQAPEPTEAPAPVSTEPPVPETTEAPWEMPTANIGGHDYIGYLSVPSLGLELPVMSSWSYPKLRIAPCRQFGTTRGNDLVIAGHNYQRHFGTLSKLTDRDVIFFTDMEGEVTCYRVGTVDVIPPKSTEEVENSPWDLILYTCTYGGRTRVMVGAAQITKQQLDAMLEQN